MNQLFLAIKHDRHQDNEYIAFENEEDAKAQCRNWVSKYPKDRYDFRENDMFGDWCLFCSDDYYVAIKEIEVIKYFR